jgi:uncharacterized protein (UPF0147 family)
MKEWVTVLRAADAAARWHVRRKGSAQEPYINHLLEVASLVAEATHGKDPDLVIAALLHDAIEDQEVPRELIERESGKRVAEVVSQVTDDKTQPKEVRKKDSGQNGRQENQRRQDHQACRQDQQHARNYVQPGPELVGETQVGIYRLGPRGRERSPRGIALARTRIRPFGRRGRKLGRRPKWKAISGLYPRIDDWMPADTSPA